MLSRIAPLRSLLKLAGTHAGPAPECPGKVALVSEAGHERDLSLRVRTVLQILLSQAAPCRFKNLPVTGSLRFELTLQHI